MSPKFDAGQPDPFVEVLLNNLCKDIYVWRMARSMLGGNDQQRKSAITRMRNAEVRIRDIVFDEVEREQVRMAVQL